MHVAAAADRDCPAAAAVVLCAVSGRLLLPLLRLLLTALAVRLCAPLLLVLVAAVYGRG
jgi:hypothetical protein